MSPEKREAAGIIRRAVWRGVMPPSPDLRPWSMARELHIWQRLVDAGTDPAELNEALTMLRTVRPSAVRLTYLTRGDGLALLADALQAARALAAQERPRNKRDDASAFQCVGDVLLTLGLAATRRSWRYSDYCGPAVVASVLGISRDRAARLLREVEPPTRESYTSVHAVAYVLGSRAWVHPTRPTLARFVRRTPRECVVTAGCRPPHFLHVRPGEIVESNGVVKPRARVGWLVPVP